MNLIQKYERWVNAYNYINGYTDKYGDPIPPHYSWNPFDDRNYWTPKVLNDFISGFRGIAYAFEAWSRFMTDKKYSPYKLPDCFWNELSDGWLWMYKKY